MMCLWVGYRKKGEKIFWLHPSCQWRNESDPELDPYPDPLVRGTDPEIRIRTKMSRIPNKARNQLSELWLVLRWRARSVYLFERSCYAHEFSVSGENLHFFFFNFCNLLIRAILSLLASNPLFIFILFHPAPPPQISPFNTRVQLIHFRSDYQMTRVWACRSSSTMWDRLPGTVYKDFFIG